MRHKRDLPWRHTTDPYLIWLSEIILQQTRVKQGMPYYEAFAEKYPTVSDLAMAEEIEVLRLWQGLGYYARARNMHATAKLVTRLHNGKFPDNYLGLLALKGIGPYTAAAIASFAYKEPVAVVDGNVFRVLARLFGIDTDIASHEGKKVFSQLANQLISPTTPDLYNQAIMEFGALLCTPASPQCMFCPFNNDCVAFLSGRQEDLPVKNKKLKIRNRFFHYLVFTHQQTIAMKERTGKDIWSGLYDFYLIEADEFQTIESLFQLAHLQFPADSLAVNEESAVYTHVLTHQRVYAKFWHLSVKNIEDVEKTLLKQRFSFYGSEEIRQLPKPILINKYLNEHIF